MLPFGSFLCLMEGMGSYRKYTPHVTRVTCHARAWEPTQPRERCCTGSCGSRGAPRPMPASSEAVLGRVPRTLARRAE
jgi:hypothetical protein